MYWPFHTNIMNKRFIKEDSIKKAIANDLKEIENLDIK